MKGKPVPSVLRSLRSEKPAPAYVLPGDGARLAEMVAEKLASRFREGGETAEIVHWSAADLERESPSAAWRSPSFFFRWRVFLLPDAGEWKQGPRKEILSYLGAPDPFVLLVIPCAERRAQNMFSSAPGVRSVQLGEDQVVAAMADFAVSRAAEAGKDLSDDAAVFLARWVGADFPRFREETHKLISFAASRKEIGEEEIRQVCVAGGKVDPFRLADDLISRDREACIDKFRKFAMAADAGDYHALVGAIAWSVRRRLSGASKAGRGRRGAEILSALSRIDRGLKGESGLSPEQLFEIHLLKLLGDGPEYRLGKR